MGYPETLAAIKAHAVAAGATLTPPITDVAVAFPLPKGRCIRIFYGGEDLPAHMGSGRTLTSQLIGEGTSIVAFWPVSTLSETEAEAIEAEIYQLKNELRTRLLGDSQLGGQTTNLDLSYVEVTLTTIGNTRYRILAWDLVTDYVEYSIAP